MTAWFVVICVGIGSLAFRAAPLAFAGRTASPRTSRFIKDAGAAAVAAITVASFDRAAHAGPVLPLAAAGLLGLALTLRRASMLRIVAAGTVVYLLMSAAVSHG
ncbi:MAG TPA: AzlD domain-containing protein [Acidimicrobiales bacterium]|nr:AzlD domain-containing protein [Acidimicrobiales bacterium]